MTFYTINTTGNVEVLYVAVDIKNKSTRINLYYNGYDENGVEFELNLYREKERQIEHNIRQKVERLLNNIQLLQANCVVFLWDDTEVNHKVFRSTNQKSAYRTVLKSVFNAVYNHSRINIQDCDRLLNQGDSSNRRPRPRVYLDSDFVEVYKLLYSRLDRQRRDNVDFSYFLNRYAKDICFEAASGAFQKTSSFIDLRSSNSPQNNTCTKMCAHFDEISRTDMDRCNRCNAQCVGDEECCQNQCVDIKENNNHCGRCNQKCKTGEVCLNGRCERLIRRCEIISGGNTVSLFLSISIDDDSQNAVVEFEYDAQKINRGFIDLDTYDLNSLYNLFFIKTQDMLQELTFVHKKLQCLGIVMDLKNNSRKLYKKDSPKQERDKTIFKAILRGINASVFFYDSVGNALPKLPKLYMDLGFIDRFFNVFRSSDRKRSLRGSHYEDFLNIFSEMICTFVFGVHFPDNRCEPNVRFARCNIQVEYRSKANLDTCLNVFSRQCLNWYTRYEAGIYVSAINTEKEFLNQFFDNNGKVAWSPNFRERSQICFENIEQLDAVIHDCELCKIINPDLCPENCS